MIMPHLTKGSTVNFHLHSFSSNFCVSLRWSIGGDLWNMKENNKIIIIEADPVKDIDLQFLFIFKALLKYNQ